MKIAIIGTNAEAAHSAEMKRDFIFLISRR